MNQASMYPTIPCPPMTSRELVTGHVEIPITWDFSDETPTRPGDSILLVLQGGAS
jgi:hypothetical protein